MRTSLYLYLAISQTLASPFKRQELVKGWPELCDDVRMRGSELWEDRQLEIPFIVMASSQNSFGYAEFKAKTSHEAISILDWAAQATTAQFDWKCNIADCELIDFSDNCETSETSAQIGLVLESASNLYSFVKSLSDAILTARVSIGDALPSMFDTFGAPDSSDGFEKAIGVVSAAAGVFGAIVETAAIPAAAVNLARSLTVMLIPAEETEKKFARYAEASKKFGENVDIIQTSIDDWITSQYVDGLEDTSTTGVQDWLTADGNFLSLIKDGDYAGLDTRNALVSSTDPNVKAALAAPILNTIWTEAKNYVIKFESGEWEMDFCGDDSEDVYPDLNKGGRICDDEGNLYMIAHWDKYPVQDGWIKGFRDVKGIDDLSDLGITRQNIIDGSINNQAMGGFKAEPKIQDLVDRLDDMQDSDDINYGVLNVWNLPFCWVGPPNGGSNDLEQNMAAAALQCGEIEINGESWPLGPLVEAEDNPPHWR